MKAIATMYEKGQRVRVLVSHTLGTISKWTVYGPAHRRGYWLCHGIGRQQNNKEFRYWLIIEAEFREDQIEPYEGVTNEKKQN